MAKHIIFFRDKKDVGRVRIDGKVHGNDFKNYNDALEWLYTMKAAGLYKDRYLIEE